MKLSIPYLQAEAHTNLQQLSLLLDQVPPVPLSNDSWPHIKTSCRAELVIAHTGQAILLKFKISNDYFRTEARKINGEVHLDNCVEFFIAFDQSGDYYNIEFNCLGIGKMAYGRQKGKRTFVATAVIREIETLTITDREGEGFNWEMTWLVPAAVFLHHEISSFEGLHASGNFYKCGDDLPEPHFLTWNRVDAPAPDFHRPDCFGELYFMPAAESVTFLK